MFERFTDQARRVMIAAQQTALGFNHKHIGTEHILLGLLMVEEGVGVQVLKRFDLDLESVQKKIINLRKIGHKTKKKTTKLPQTPRTKQVIQYAIEEARNLNHNYVGTEHLLLGILREHDGVAAQVLMSLDLELKEVREKILDLLGVGPESQSEPSTAGECILPGMKEPGCAFRLDRDLNGVLVLLRQMLLKAPAQMRHDISASLRSLAESIDSIPSDPTDKR